MQSVVRHVQAGEVPGKVWRDCTEAEVAAVSSAVLHMAGGLLLAGHAMVRSRHKVTYDDHCREEKGTWGTHRSKDLK